MYQSENAGFEILSTIHDEIWGAQSPGRDEEFKRAMCILPHWCQDIQLTADGEAGIRYLK
jgi:hypothetical protein